MKEIKKKTTLMKYIELKESSSIEELLYKLYIEEELSIKEIAKQLGVSKNTIMVWLHQIEISTRLPHQKMLEVIEIKRELKRRERKND